MGFEQMPDINKIRKELDEKNTEMEEKERERIKEEYERLSEQEKPTEEPITKEGTSKSEKEQPVQIEDITDEFTPENVKVAENIKAAYEKGKFIEVKVKGSSGKIENDWVISKINPRTGEATVLKFTSEEGENRSFEDKIVTLEELKEWNKPEIKEPKKKKEKAEDEDKEEKLDKKEGNKRKKTEGKRTNAKDIEWKKTKVDKKEVNKVLKRTKEKSKKGKEEELIEENIKDQLKKSGLGSKEISKILPRLFESFKNPEVREKIQKLIKTEQFQEIQNIIEKTIKNEASAAAEGTKDSIQKETEVAESEEKKEKLDPWKSYKKRVEIWKEFRKAPDYDGVMDSILNKSSEELNDYLKQNQSKLSKEAQSWVKEEIKEKDDKEEELIEENIKDQLKKSGLGSKEISKILPGLFESFKNPEVSEKIQELMETEQWQELEDIIGKTMKKKVASDSVAETKESIEKKEGGKESPWKTVFGTIGWSILLFLVLFMLAELKGIDYFSGQATGKKKEKK